MSKEALKLAIQLRDTASGYWTENEISIIEKLIEALAQPAQETDEFLLRGILASELKCFHRLTADETRGLVHFIQNMGAKLEPTDSMGMPTSCGKPLCSPGNHHSLCKLAEQPAPVQQEPVAVYGYYPQCGAKGVMRERRPNGNDKCANGHTYPSSTSTPQQRKPDDEAFMEWASKEGYDTAHTINSDNGKFIALNPVTADLWKAWQAAHGIKE